jgi:hypothetical protein
MSWVDLTTGQTDAESPVNDTLMDQIRSNEDYLFDSALRGGTFGTPVRLVVARGVKAVSITVNTQIGATGIYRGANTYTVTFSTDSDDGDPGFSANPRVYATFYSQDTDLTGTNAAVVTPYVNSDSNTQTIINVNAWCPASATIAGNLYWMAIGPPTAGE